VTAALEVRGLVKAFGATVAVDGVSFDLQPGEKLAMIGPNGAGKSTCFNLLSGQIRPDAGAVRLFGTRISGRSPGAIWRRGVGRTFQITATFGSMTVAENIETVLQSVDRRSGALYRRQPQRLRERAGGLLDRVGIAALAGRPCGALAYGDVKRVELTMALANAPRLLLMDEPTAGMAGQERQALMALVSDLVAADGLTVLFTEHDMDVVFGHADRILVLHRGRVIALGPPGAVRADPQVREIYLGRGEGTAA
jgi:branched-chain amino acid transport system ATP-binding protein